MTKRIFQSIMLVSGAVLIASMMITLGFLYNYFSDIEEGQLENELGLAALAVEGNGEYYLKKLDSGRYRLTWISEDGRVLYDTRADEKNMENHAEREEVKQALQNTEGKSSRYSATLLERTIYYAQRLDDGSVLRISVSHATVWALALGMLGPILLVLAAALSISCVLARRISRRIVEPLERLDLENPLENNVYEELSPLLRRISRQRGQIDAQFCELQRKNDEFAQITQSMREGLVLVNERGCILSINPAAMELFHTSSSCVEKDFMTIERGSGINRAIREAYSEGHGETRLEQEGREYQIDISRIESRGTVIGAVLLAFDITEKASAERSRREFTANVSHELKTPLQSIMGGAELIENGLVKAEDMTCFAGRIRTEASRLVTLIEDIIRLSQLDEGGAMPFEEVDLLEIANEVVSSLRENADKGNISIRVLGGSCVIKGVRRLVSEIVYNLCDNAVKYNVHGGSVEVCVGRSENGGAIRVSDTGIGIPPEHQERIFERFYRVDKSRSRESGGTGLGLSIVKHAVRYLGGEIELHSVPGKGTAIKVSL